MTKENTGKPTYFIYFFKLSVTHKIVKICFVWKKLYLMCFGKMWCKNITVQQQVDQVQQPNNLFAHFKKSVRTVISKLKIYSSIILNSFMKKLIFS